jgi:hypothetical protein
MIPKKRCIAMSKMSDDEREFYRKMFMYGPWLVKDMAKLAYCLSTFYEAQASGATLEIAISQVAPTFKGYVTYWDDEFDIPKETTNFFEGAEDLQYILKRYTNEEKFHAEG